MYGELITIAGKALISLFNEATRIRKTKDELGESQLSIKELYNMGPIKLAMRVQALRAHSLQLLQGRDIYAQEFDQILVYLYKYSATPSSYREVITSDDKTEYKNTQDDVKFYNYDANIITSIYKIQSQLKIIADLRSELEDSYIELLSHDYEVNTDLKTQYSFSKEILKESPTVVFQQDSEEAASNRSTIDKTLDDLKSILSRERQKWEEEDSFQKRVSEVSSEIEELYKQIYQQGIQLDENLRAQYQKARDMLIFQSSLNNEDKQTRLAEARQVLIELQILKGKQEQAEQERALALQKAEEERKRIEEQKKEQDDTEKKRTRNRLIFIASFIIIPLTLFFLGLGLLIWQLGIRPNETQLTIPYVGIPYSVVLWSALGSIASMLHLVNVSQEQQFQKPWKTFRWAVTRPLIGIIMGLVFYLAAYGGLFLTMGEFSPKNYTLLWLIAFIGGFSDRAQQAVIATIVGKIKALSQEAETQVAKNND